MASEPECEAALQGSRQERDEQWIGVAEVFGNAVYVVGSTQSIAIAAVLASQFGAVAAVAAFVLFHERLSIMQRSGVVAIALGVAVLTLVRA